jgi:hypothetical protein
MFLKGARCGSQSQLRNKRIRRTERGSADPSQLRNKRMPLRTEYLPSCDLADNGIKHARNKGFCGMFQR